MRQTQVLTAVAVFAVFGTVNHAQSLAEAWQGNAMTHLSGTMTRAASVSDGPQQGQKSSSQFDRSRQESLIHKVGADSYGGGGYSGMPGTDIIKSGAAPSTQATAPSNQPHTTGEYKFSSPGSQGGYGVNPSDNYFRKEASGTTSSPYGGAVYGGVPSTPSADPMIKGLSREP